MTAAKLIEILERYSREFDIDLKRIDIKIVKAKENERTGIFPIHSIRSVGRQTNSQFLINLE